jgi:hypothetical protein
VGDFEAGTLVSVESSLGYHPSKIDYLTHRCVAGGTVSGRQFDWGGRLPKSNGGAQRFPQNGWKSFEERKGKRELDCETDKSNRYESRT